MTGAFTRRGLLRSAGTAAIAGLTASPLSARVSAALRERRDAGPDELARDEAFWRPIQNAYTTDRAHVNLNNGGVSPCPFQVQEALFTHWRYANQSPVQHMWRHQEPRREMVRTQLAELFGCDAEEVALVRNATEALETVTFGLDLEPGDEVISTEQDYPRMITAWRQRAAREGIVFKQVSLPTHPTSDEDIVARFRAAITPRTRLLHFCHVINLTGQILPVRPLADLARSHGAFSLVDGAHAFAHFQFRADELGCDYYGTSLHKWLSAPFGTGMLYARRDRIAEVWPLFAATDPQSADIRKFEQYGTHPCPIFLAVGEAAHFQQTLGTDVKEARLRYLKDFWVDALADLDNVRLHTPREPSRSCGIATVEIDGVAPGALNRWLYSKHRIVTTVIRHEDTERDDVPPEERVTFRGLRITPHVYTTRAELQRFVGAMRLAAEHGID